MTSSQLVMEIRDRVRQYVDGSWSLAEFRRWFVDADGRAHHGVLSGLADPQAVAITDEIMVALSDLDDGFVEAQALPHILAVIATIPRGPVRFQSRDTSLGHLYRRPASVIEMETSFVPA